jgi:hypothetical protein
MKEYTLIYRSSSAEMPQITAEQGAAMMQRWVKWMDDMKNNGQLVSMGNRLNDKAGKLVKPNNVVTNGPYAEIKEAIGGYSIVKAASLDAASEIAKGCPILSVGGSVEVREIIDMMS